MSARCVGCGRRAVQRHHAVYKQAVRRAGGDVRAPANLVDVCLRCHERHHTRTEPLALRVLPDAVFVFALELMGAAAYDYLARRYAGGDPRLDALLDAR